ncbi:SDR family oxidoreductase [Leptolyngbya sp. NIES-2104]|uniref:SDR family oxidoreductase n=1 Tax=Leptolyngbya sp. NIES-2104 TaxID=1552121 RepID=UPI0006EC803F|nr:SDR family oxidoreductase [Leptolyngbya sp. NIES-2104]GAP99992.1 3-oxoacyl-[acyl-carrier protein] reductase [Leptolyngbya sp. NIES-2104]
MTQRPIVLVTGASRNIGIGSSIAKELAQSGWDVALTYWQPYDVSMPWGSNPKEVQLLRNKVESFGVRSTAIEVDLSLVDSAEQIFNAIERDLGTVSALVMSHCHSVDSDILSTSVESFDLHFAINARATWLLVREFGKRFQGEFGTGRIVAITSDHTAGNLPYGASKGAMDRIVLASAQEFRALGIAANVINPGATDTGWMSTDLKTEMQSRTLLNRVGMPQDCANLVKFLCSKEGGWINGQLLYSNGGFQ